jgi:hypothetical protein
MDHGLLGEIGSDWTIIFPEKVTEEALLHLLAEKINTLIQDDFNKLLTLLYRIDIDERKLKSLLQDHPDQDAGLLIAGMVLERQQQKAEARKKYRSDHQSDQNQEEKW